jgi:coproporphyrinogen III oxidase-like Fe-S oxidoreductase
MLSPMDPARLSERLRLHADYLRTCKPVDASQLTFEGAGRRSWGEAEVAALWAQAPARPDGRRARNHVYVHVPFCKSICSFCNYERLRPSSPAVLRAWLDQLQASLAALAPAVQHLRFHTLYFGGGTPSVLTAAMLREAVDAIHGALRFHRRAHRTFELDPAVMNREKLDALVARGFAHFSFGVQTLDPAVNADHNRGAQGPALVGRRFEEFAAAGLGRVSIDFLLGMAGTTPSGAFGEIDEALARWRPQWIDVYLITPTPAYLASHFGGDRAAFEAHLAPFRERAGEALAGAARARGYTLQSGGDHRYVLTRRPGPRDVLRMGRRLLTESRLLDPFTYHQTVTEQGGPINLLGLGPSARSRIYGRARLTRREGPGEAPRYEGRAVSAADESASYLIYRLRDADDVDRADFRRVFGVDLVERHALAVEGWRSQGLLAWLDRRRLQLVAQGRPERLEALLWLASGADLQAEIDQRR